jgi:predicted acetyltransferase
LEEEHALANRECPFAKRRSKGAVTTRGKGGIPFLTEPTERYRASYLEALQEFQAEGRSVETSLEEVSTNFVGFVQHLRDQADRTEFWLIDGTTYIGRLPLRRELNERQLQMGGHIGYAIRPSCRRQGYGKLILKYGLERAKAFGLERVLLTCDENNLSSRKIIVFHGGILENIIEVEGWPTLLCRYWIHL